MTGPEKEALSVLQPFLGEELAKAIVEFRRHTKKSPLTGYAAKLLVKEYQLTRDPIAAAEMQIAMSWQGFRSTWYFNELAKTGQRHSASSNGSMADFTRTMMEQMNGQPGLDDGRDASPQFSLGFSPASGRSQRH